MQNTNSPARTSEASKLLLPFALLLFATLYIVGYFFIEEDSYIYFRVAENIAQGYGYVFNIGDIPIESGSGPLWQYLLALGALIGCNMVTQAKAMGLVFGIATLVLMNRTATRLSTPLIGGCLTIALAASVPFVWWSGSGLETSLYTCLMMLCIHQAITPERSSWVAALPFALLLLARPEAFISVGCFFAYLLCTSRVQLAIRLLIASLLIYGGYLVFRYFYFGEIQISPFYAKISVDGVQWGYLWGVLKEYRLLYLLALVVPAALFWRRTIANGPFVLLALLTGAGLFFAAANFDLKVYHRFFAHCLPTLLLLVAVSAGRLRQALPTRLTPWMAGYVVAASLAVAWLPRVPDIYVHTRNPYFAMLDQLSEQPSLVLASITRKIANPHTVTEVDETLQGTTPHVINANYQSAVGHFLHDNYPQGLTIAYDQMGQTPYFAGQRQNFIDFLGLATRPIGLFYFNQNARNSTSKSLYKEVVDPLLHLQRAEDRDIDANGAMSVVEQANPEVVIIHLLVATSDRTLTYRVLHSDWLKQNYVLRYRLATWLQVYERSDRQFPLVATHFPKVLQFSEVHAGSDGLANGQPAL